MKVEVLVGFAGIVYSGSRGKVLDLPASEAKSLAAQGIVKILEDQKEVIAYETAVKKVGRPKK